MIKSSFEGLMILRRLGCHGNFPRPVTLRPFLSESLPLSVFRNTLKRKSLHHHYLPSIDYFHNPVIFVIQNSQPEIFCYESQWNHCPTIEYQCRHVNFTCPCIDAHPFTADPDENFFFVFFDCNFSFNGIPKDRGFECLRNGPYRNHCPSVLYHGRCIELEIHRLVQYAFDPQRKDILIIGAYQLRLFIEQGHFLCGIQSFCLIASLNQIVPATKSKISDPVEKKYYSHEEQSDRLLYRHSPPQ